MSDVSKKRKRSSRKKRVEQKTEPKESIQTCTICTDELRIGPLKTEVLGSHHEDCSQVCKTSCGHSFHALCLHKWYAMSEIERCPICRSESPSCDRPFSLHDPQVFIASICILQSSLRQVRAEVEMLTHENRLYESEAAMQYRPYSSDIQTAIVNAYLANLHPASAVR